MKDKKITMVYKEIGDLLLLYEEAAAEERSRAERGVFRCDYCGKEGSLLEELKDERYSHLHSKCFDKIHLPKEEFRKMVEEREKDE